MSSIAMTAANSGVPLGVPLRLALKRIERRRKVAAFMLVLPLLLFIVVTFVFPIGRMVFNAVHDNVLLILLPNTMAELRNWDGKDLPDEAAYAALAGDLKAAEAQKTAFQIGKRINYEFPGTISQVTSSATKVKGLTAGPYKAAMIGISPLWGRHEVWSMLKRGRSAYTAFFLLRSTDHQFGPDSEIVRSPRETAIFENVFLRTIGISIGVTAAALLLAFPVAYLLATLPARTSNLLIIMVLLPLWTSTLVRTTAWVILLQQNGVVNEILLVLHLVSKPAELIFNRIGTVVAMTHIQLPFMLLPIYSVMKQIPSSQLRAARSLGAGPFYAFWKVYFPQTLTGIAASCLMGLITCLGYYITPALVGGPSDQMVSSFVAQYTNDDLNWGMASALGVILLTATLVLYYVFNKLVGVNRLTMG